MNAIVKEWVVKANGDYDTATRELKVTDQPNHDAVCFHAQQCIEKLMKAVLIDRQITPQRTPDLFVLAQSVQEVESSFHQDATQLRFLSQAAIAFRYPGDSAQPQDAIQAVAICKALRTVLLELLHQG